MLKTICWPSSVGKKVVMAVSGLFLLGFVLAHLSGNLLIFLGPEALNAYAKKLRDLGPILWAMRIGLLATAVVHVWLAISLTLENRKARPIPYECKTTIQTSFAARTMMLSGVLILIYIAYHLLHFTFHVVHHAPGEHAHDVYSMVVLSFQNLWISLVYCVAMVVLGFHLCHGFSSLFQSLGLNNECFQKKLKWVSRVVALTIVLGYSSIPISVLLGFVSLSTGVQSH